MDDRLLYAYGAWILLAVLIAGLLWFGTRARRAHSREHGRDRKVRKKPSRV